MHELGIYKGSDLYEWSEMALIQEFGKMGYSLYRKVRGIHDSPVSVTRERKSVGKEHTYGNALTTEDQVISQLRNLAEEVERSLKRTQKHGKTVGVESALCRLLHHHKTGHVARVYMHKKSYFFTS